MKRASLYMANQCISHMKDKLQNMCMPEKNRSRGNEGKIQRLRQKD